MSKLGSEVRVFGDGGIYVAPVGTSFPANIGAAISSASFTHLGYLDPAGPQFSFGRETQDIEVWQSFDPVRTVTTKVPKTLKATLMQMNRHTTLVAFGGGTWAEGSSGQYSYTPPEASEIAEYATIVETIDGDYTYRWCFARGTLDSATEFAALRTDATKLAVSLKFLAPDSGSTFIIQTDDPAFDPSTLDS